MRPTYGLVPTTGVISIEAEKDIIGMSVCFIYIDLSVEQNRFSKAR